MTRIPVAVLGATGMVGQRLLQLLDTHPWFEPAFLGASEQSAGDSLASQGRWRLPGPVPAAARLAVRSLAEPFDCPLAFSALPADVALSVEARLADAGTAVCSNASAHRLVPDVPLLIPEVNPDQASLIESQRRRRGSAGFIATNPNCSTAQLVLALKPLHDAFGLEEVTVTTLQAVSGAGYPGQPALDVLDNVIPHIAGEEEKLEREPCKLLGDLPAGLLREAEIRISAQCNRVAVSDGHLACVTVRFRSKPAPADVYRAWREFRGAPDVATLPSSPPRPLQVHLAADRPQPRLDRDNGGGMTVAVGRLQPSPLGGFKFVVLGHNTVRGAAGAALHNAELLLARGWLAGRPGQLQPGRMAIAEACS